MRKPVRKRKALVKPRYRVAGSKSVWLTFDDGPHPRHTGKVLDVLAQHGITAVFFLIGKHAAEYPVIMERIVREGHLIGNHTWGHPKLTALSRARIRQELVRTERIIAPHVTGAKLFRPPYGAHNAVVDEVSAGLGYRTIIWNVDPADWDRAQQPTKWMQTGIGQIRARSHAVVLNHDIYASTANNLDTFIRRIKALGNVRFRKASEL
jgi:peptidoglycan/xylan/chitin deacetylase (PgdA/CDA1 family)